MKPKRIKTGGRRAGTPNKSTASVKQLAQQHSAGAIRTLAMIMAHSIDDKARIAAANSLLDRGHGKPAQTLDMAVTSPPITYLDITTEQVEAALLKFHESF